MEKDLDAMVEGMQKIVDTRVDNIFDTFNHFVSLAREDFNDELSAMQAKFMEFQALFGEGYRRISSKDQRPSGQSSRGRAKRKGTGGTE